MAEAQIRFPDGRVPFHAAQRAFRPGVLIVAAMGIGVLLTSPAHADSSTDHSPGSFAYGLVGGVALAIMVGLATIRSSLMVSNWSLSDAVSEEADVSPLDKEGKPIPGPDGKPTVVTELRASSSRLIALVGLVSILMTYIGFGMIVLRDFALGSLPSGDDIQRVIYFQMSGLVMFAPYVVNKFSSIFDWLKPPVKPSRVAEAP